MFTSPARRLTPRKRRTRLGLDQLSARIVPAVVLTQLDLDGDGAADDIRITGDLRNNKVTIHDDGQSLLQVQIDANGDGDVADGGDLAQQYAFTGDSMVVEVNLGAGSDSVQYIADAPMLTSARTVTANLGGGNDTFVWNMGTNLINSKSRIALDVTTGFGADTVDVTFGQVLASVVSVRTDLGAGIDSYDLAFGNIDEKASVDVDTDLGSGPNTHSVTLAGVGFNIQGVVDMAIVGGNQKDTVQVRLNNDVGGGAADPPSRLSITADLLGGDDVFQGVLDATGVNFRVDDRSQASISVRGGAGNDNLSVSRDGTNVMLIDPDAIMAIDLDGGLGNDTIGVNFGGSNAWQIEGTLRVRLEGGAGADVLNCLLSNNSTSPGAYDVAVHGGDGTDSVTFGLTSSGGATTFGPAGGVILDGGAGTDALTNATPQVTFKSAFETIA
jgi:hypothetical protein